MGAAVSASSSTRRQVSSSRRVGGGAVEGGRAAVRVGRESLPGFNCTLTLHHPLFGRAIIVTSSHPSMHPSFNPRARPPSEAGEPVVYVATGTIAKPTQQQVDAITSAMRDVEGARFVWALPKACHHLLPADLSSWANGKLLILPWAPQQVRVRMYAACPC